MTRNFHLMGGYTYVSEPYLIEKGIPEKHIEKYRKEFSNGKRSLGAYFQQKLLRWYAYRLLPLRWVTKYNLPISEDKVYALHELQEEYNRELQRRHIDFIFKHTWETATRWKRYVPIYRPYYFDEDIIILFAKTHAIFFEIIELKKRYNLDVIHQCYCLLNKPLFQTKNYKSFSAKIRIAEKEDIENALIHDYKINGRQPYKVDAFLISRAKYYYTLSGKSYTQEQVSLFVNNERLDRGLESVSFNTIKKILSRPEIRNTCDQIRYGSKYSEEYIYPFLNRKDPEFAELLMVDSTRINIPSKVDEKSQKTRFLHLCVIMEVHSRMIIGYAISYSENTNMILAAMKMALTTLGYVPTQILHDNHKLYFSKEYKKFSSAAFDCGIDFRNARIGNARDKSHVERWFGTFQTEFTNQLYGSMGEGIRTKRIGGRVSKELEQEYLKPVNVRVDWQLVKLIGLMINKYNQTPRKNKISPNEKFKNANRVELKQLLKPDILKMFYQVKRNKPVRNEMIHVNENSYTIKNRILADKLNNTKITIRFDPEDMSTISIYTDTDEYVCDINADYKISPVAKGKDWQVINTYQKEIDERIAKNIADLSKEFSGSEQMLESIAITSLNPKSNDIFKKAEHELLMEKTLKKPVKRKKKEISKPTSNDRKPLSINVQKGSMKRIKK